MPFSILRSLPPLPTMTWLHHNQDTNMDAYCRLTLAPLVRLPALQAFGASKCKLLACEGSTLPP
jgi:hypothetical protein